MRHRVDEGPKIDASLLSTTIWTMTFKYSSVTKRHWKLTLVCFSLCWYLGAKYNLSHSYGNHLYFNLNIAQSLVIKFLSRYRLILLELWLVNFTRWIEQVNKNFVYLSNRVGNKSKMGIAYFGIYLLVFLQDRWVTARGWAM